MTRPTAAGYVAWKEDDDIISGFGHTAEETWRMVLNNIPEASTLKFVVCPASATLLGQIRLDGGAVAFRVHRGVACAVDVEDPDKDAHIPPLIGILAQKPMSC